MVSEKPAQFETRLRSHNVYSRQISLQTSAIAKRRYFMAYLLIIFYRSRMALEPLICRVEGRVDKIPIALLFIPCICV
jgi:hypothetical protein